MRYEVSFVIATSFCNCLRFHLLWLTVPRSYIFVWQHYVEDPAVMRMFNVMVELTQEFMRSSSRGGHIRLVEDIFRENNCQPTSSAMYGMSWGLLHYVVLLVFLIREIYYLLQCYCLEVRAQFVRLRSYCLHSFCACISILNYTMVALVHTKRCMEIHLQNW